MKARAIAAALLILKSQAAGAPAAPPDDADVSARLAPQVLAIFEVKCIECHGADMPRPKGNFGYVLDLPKLAANPDYVVPGSPEKSELYLMVENDEMPGDQADVPPLTAGEKAIVRRWIETGAHAAGSVPGAGGGASPKARFTIVAQSPGIPFGLRLLRWVGQFHPPSSHFPIALLIVALPAEFMYQRTRRSSWKAAVRFCVTLGAACSVFTALLGWCDAAFANYTGSLAPALAWHRWVGTATAVWAVITAVLSEFAHRESHPRRLRYAFRVMLGAGIILVSVTGYLGASLIYGPNHFRW